MGLFRLTVLLFGPEVHRLVEMYVYRGRFRVVEFRTKGAGLAYRLHFFNDTDWIYLCCGRKKIAVATVRHFSWMKEMLHHEESLRISKSNVVKHRVTALYRHSSMVHSHTKQ